MMKSASIPLLVTSAALSLAAAQQQPNTTFRTTTELVLVPAVVTHDRQPVRNLKQKDFTVFQDGKPQKISVFDEIEEDRNSTEEVPAEPQTISNYRFATPHQAVTIILLDFLNITPFGWENLHKQFADAVRVLIETNTPVEVLTLSWNGLIEIMPVTGDPNDLLSAALRWKSMKNQQVPVGASRIPRLSGADGIAKLLEIYGVTPDRAPSDVLDKRTQEFDARSMVFAAVEEIAQAYKGQPGRKKLIWITSDIPAYLKRSGGPQIWREEFPAEELVALKALTDANIAIYPIVENQIKVVDRDICGMPLSPDFYLMYETGGSVCDEAPETCIRKIGDDAKHYYMLGFYLRGKMKPGWHKLKVKVGDSKLDVRAKQAFIVGYSPGANGIFESDEKFIEAALKAPLHYTGLPLSLQWKAVGAEEKDWKLELLVRTLPGAVKVEGDPMRLNLGVVVHVNNDDTGKSEMYDSSISKEVTAAEQKQLRDIGFQYRTSVTLPEGHYQVKVLLRDNTTELAGTVSAPVDLARKE